MNLCSVCMQSPLLTTSAHRHVRFEIIIITIVGRWKKCKEKGELFAALGLVGENKNCAYNTGKWRNSIPPLHFIHQILTIISDYRAFWLSVCERTRMCQCKSIFLQSDLRWHHPKWCGASKDKTFFALLLPIKLLHRQHWRLKIIWNFN